MINLNQSQPNQNRLRLLIILWINKASQILFSFNENHKT